MENNDTQITYIIYSFKNTKKHFLIFKLRNVIALENCYFDNGILFHLLYCMSSLEKMIAKCFSLF